MEDARFYPIIAGARGKRPINLGAVARILSQLSILAAEQPEVKTVDLNPIMVASDRALVVDAKIGLR
jgi:acetate---CoA ligase (ADP-forming) subunit beta